LELGAKCYSVCFATEDRGEGAVAVEVPDEAIQLLGDFGYITGYEVDRFYRDAKITEIYEGTM